MRNSGFLFLKKYPNVCAAGAWPSPLRTLGRRAAGGGPASPPASATGDAKKNVAEEDYSSNLMSDKWETVAQGVDPKRGWNFRGVHKAILCGKVRQTPVQKLLRNGKTLTVFNVGTGGMFDQRSLSGDLPRPAQWHRIVVHNEVLGAYAVQQLTKNSSVYVEGDIELRVYNKGITGEVVKLPEICVRTNGKIRLIRTGEAINNISFQELRSCNSYKTQELYLPAEVVKRSGVKIKPISFEEVNPHEGATDDQKKQSGGKRKAKGKAGANKKTRVSAKSK